MVVMRLIIDENVPETVTAYLRERGHIVEHVRDLFLTSTPDAIIAAVASHREALVVTWDSDFRRIAKRIPKGGRSAVRKLGLITFRCNESHGLLRAQQVFEAIEAEYERRQRMHDKRLFVEIKETEFTFSG